MSGRLRIVPAVLACALLLGGCSADRTPSSPAGSALEANTLSPPPSATRVGGPPGYEPAYFGGDTYIINAIEVPNHAPPQAQADFYEVVYPIGWQSMGLPAPQCNPCDHDGGGIDFIDYHDHVLDSVPGNPGGGEYHALWHVWVIIPNYTGNAEHDAAVNAAYAAQLPTTSEAAVNALLALTLPDGSPVAIKIDPNFYFLCAVVGKGHQG